jgi:ubiquinone biosynthesis monooxygenase Coq7
LPDIVPALTKMLADEVDHCAKFSAAMPARGSRPCRIMRLWSLGGYILGGATALMGRRTVWVCTAAVEEAVHRHLDEQMHFLQSRDPALHGIIDSIREEELDHLTHAVDELAGKPQSAFERALYRSIGLITEALIWLSTWGDSTRMTHALIAARTPRLSGS